MTNSGHGYAKRWGYDVSKNAALLQLGDRAPVGIYEIKITSDCGSTTVSRTGRPGQEFQIQVNAEKHISGEIHLAGERVDTFWCAIPRAVCPKCNHEFRV